MKKEGRDSDLPYVIISFINIKGKYTFRARSTRELNLSSDFRYLMKKKDMQKSIPERNKIAVFATILNLLLIKAVFVL